MKKVLILLTTVFAMSLMASGGADLFKKCASCHGAKAEKKALGRSHVIANFSEDQIVKALTGYKDGSYGGPMKAIMKGQVAKFNAKDIKDVAKYIKTLK